MVFWLRIPESDLTKFRNREFFLMVCSIWKLQTCFFVHSILYGNVKYVSGTNVTCLVSCELPCFRLFLETLQDSLIFIISIVVTLKLVCGNSNYTLYENREDIRQKSDLIYYAKCFAIGGKCEQESGYLQCTLKCFHGPRGFISPL